MVRWDITKENLSLLDNVRDIEVGTLDLHCSEVGNDDLKRITRFVKEYGVLLHTLYIRPEWSLEKGDFEHLDFASHCPHLHVLDIKQVIVNESVFAHPSLEILILEDSHYKGPREIIIGDGLRERDGRHLKQVNIMDCFIPVDKLTIGPAAQLKKFNYYLDEDFSEPEVSPADFVFQECPQLESITIHACASWKNLIKGFLPQLTYISLDATEYCSYQFEIEGVDEQQRAVYNNILEQDD